MPLDTTNFHPQGPVKSVDLLQFYNLFTGLMTDQPVTFSNSVTIGGNQGLTTVPLRVYGAVGQNTNLIDLYADHNQAQPGFGFSALGRFGWGPGGASPQDTFLSRIATQHGHATDTPGLLVTPYLEVAGNISADGYLFANGATLTGPMADPNYLLATQALAVNTINQRIRLQPISGGGNYFVLESVDASSQLWSKNAIGLNTNLYYNGTSWVHYDTAAASISMSMDTVSGFDFHTSPAGSGAVTALTQLASINMGGVVSARSNFVANTGRLGNAGGILFQVQNGGSANDVNIFAENGAAYIWFNNANGLLYVQQNSGIGSAWCRVQAQGFWATATTALGSGNVGCGFMAGQNGLAYGGYNASGGIQALIGTTGDNYNSIWCLQSGIVFVNYNNTVRLGTIDNAGNLAGFASIAVNANLWFSTAGGALVFANNAGIYLGWDGTHINASVALSSAAYIVANTSLSTNSGVVYFRSDNAVLIGWNGFGGPANNIYLNQSVTLYGGLTINYARGANAGGYVLQVSNGGAANDVHVFAENGHVYWWAGNANANYYFQASNNSAWGTCNAKAFTVSSARKRKTNIRVLEDPLGFVLDDTLHAVRYDERDTGLPSMGFVADDWLCRAPEVVNFDDNGEVSMLDYDRISAITFEALKQHVIRTNARLDALERQAA